MTRWWFPKTGPRSRPDALRKRRRLVGLRVERLEDRRLLTITNVPVPVTVQEGIANAVVVASFTDSDNVTPANFTSVSINWGDGTTATTGTVNGVGGAGATYLVTGSHTYAEEGARTVTVTLHDTQNNADVTLPSNTATVQDAPLSPGTKVTAGTPKTFSGVGGTSTTGNALTALQSFETAIGGNNNGSTASAQSSGFRTINWDDVLLNGTDFSGATTTIKANSTVGIPTNRYQERGVQFGNLLAVSVDSGSGSFTDVNANVSGLFPAFSAKNTVAAFNGNTMTVSFVLASAHTSTATTAATKGFGAIFRNVEVANTTSLEYFNGATSLGKFFVPASTKGDAEFFGVLFSSSIVTSVQLTLGTGVVFNFNGTTATAGGSDDPAAAVNLVAADDFAYAEPAAVPNNPTTSVAATQSTAFTGAVGTFTDANGSATTKDFSATIKWGDGHSSPGTVTQNKDGSFTVTGTNTYSSSGRFTIQTTVTDLGGSTTSISASAQVASTSTNPGPPVQSGTPNQNFVNQVYLDLLGRSADVSGLGTWSGQLDLGVSKQTVLTAIQSSTEFRQDLIQNLYSHYLKRNVDSSGMQSFLTLFQQGGTETQAADILMGSTEYFQVRGGSSNSGWLSAVYQDVLGRALDSNGAASFGNSLTNGVSLSRVAAAISLSAEGQQHAVDVLFQDLLRRHSDSSGNQHWAAVLTGPSLGGIPPEAQIMAGLVNSAEYAADLQTTFPLKPAMPKDPLAASLP